MKKILSIMVMLACALAIHAKQEVTIVSGDKSVFKQEATVNVVFDDHNPIIGDTGQTAQEYFKNATDEGDTYEDFIAAVDIAHEHFYKWFQFNKKKSKVRLQRVDTPAQYTLRVVVKNINTGNGAGMANPWSKTSGGARLTGHMQLVDNATQQVVCELSFNDVQGGKGYTFKQRAQGVYGTVAKFAYEALK